MPIDNYFDTIFAASGDRTAVPDATDPSGYVSYTQGYTSDYEVASSDPNYKPIERDKWNDIMYEVTKALQQYQQHGTPPFITSAMNGGSPYSYSKYDRVLYSGVTYQSLEDSNTDTPPSSKWFSDDPIEILKRGYPVGSVYINYSDNTNPATLLGFGTWTSLQDRFLVGAGGTYTAGTTGGATTSTLTSSQIPALTYNIKVFGSSAAGTSNLSETGVTDSQNATATNAITTNAGGGSHSILNSYVAVYMWHRTA